MINRVLIRTKVVQNLYSYMLTKPDRSLSTALKDLESSLDKTYELYHYLLRLPVELTHIQEMRLDEARNKYMPTEEDLHPNMKFVNNRLVAAMMIPFSSVCCLTKSSRASCIRSIWPMRTTASPATACCGNSS